MILRKQPLSSRDWNYYLIVCFISRVLCCLTSKHTSATRRCSSVFKSNQTDESFQKFPQQLSSHRAPASGADRTRLSGLSRVYRGCKDGDVLFRPDSVSSSGIFRLPGQSSRTPPPPHKVAGLHCSAFLFVLFLMNFQIYDQEVMHATGLIWPEEVSLKVD